LYPFEWFDGKIDAITNPVNQFPAVQQAIIKEIFYVKEAKSRRGNQYMQFVAKLVE